MSYRKIHDSFWTDPDMEELTPEQKFFYIYLITNPNVNQIGLYEFSIKRAVFETGYNRDTIEKLIKFFEEQGKIRRSTTSKEIVVCKFYYHNKSNSPKVKIHVEGLLKEVKDTSLIQYIYGMDTASQEEEVQEEEKEEEYPIPTLLEVQEFFRENGYQVSIAEKAFNYYNESVKGTRRKYWRDGKGNIVNSWKMKMRSTWFKEENKVKPGSVLDGGTF